MDKITFHGLGFTKYSGGSFPGMSALSPHLSYLYLFILHHLPSIFHVCEPFAYILIERYHRIVIGSVTVSVMERHGQKNVAFY